MDAPTAIDGAEGPLVTRRIVVWRRLEPGDVRTPGAEIAPESPHIEAKVVEIGIAEQRYEDLARLWKKREEVTAIATSWSARYEPAGALLALGGSLVFATLLDMLPLYVLPFAGSVIVLAIAAGVFTKVRKKTREREAERRWRATEEREALEKNERLLTPRWDRFATKLREETGFRTDVRVGDIHEAERLVSIDPSKLTHPDTWKPDEKPNEVRYGWMYRDGRVVEQKAELEDNADAESESDSSSADPPSEPLRRAGDAGETSESELESESDLLPLLSSSADPSSEPLRRAEGAGEISRSESDSESDAESEPEPSYSGPRKKRRA